MWGQGRGLQASSGCEGSKGQPCWETEKPVQPVVCTQEPFSSKEPSDMETPARGDLSNKETSEAKGHRLSIHRGN